MVVMLVALWALASNHCRLENIPGLAFMPCSDQADCAGQEDKDCEADGCATVENQIYKTESTPELPPAPVFAFAFLPAARFDHHSLPGAVRLVLLDAVPRRLARAWQFSCRTALPPRAPSLLS